jgi:hypothetical protein
MNVWKVCPFWIQFDRVDPIDNDWDWLRIDNLCCSSLDHENNDDYNSDMLNHWYWLSRIIIWLSWWKGWSIHCFICDSASFSCIILFCLAFSDWIKNNRYRYEKSKWWMINDKRQRADDKRETTIDNRQPTNQHLKIKLRNEERKKKMVAMEFEPTLITRFWIWLWLCDHMIMW